MCGGRVSVSPRELLAENDVPCEGCRYNLRGQTGDVCPECGRAISVEHVRRTLETRAWREKRMPGDRLVMVGLIGSVFGLGYAAGAAGTLVRVFMTEMPFAARVVFVSTLAPLALAYPALAWLYLTRTAWIEKRTRRGRLMLALAAWMLAPLDVLLLLLPLFFLLR